SEGSVLGQVLAGHRIANYRIAGSDRFPHVTSFFNGGADPSIYECALQVEYTDSHQRDSEPERESFKVADKFLQRLKAEEPGVFVINFSAAALAAETGSLERTVEAIQYVDTCLGGVVEKVRDVGGVSL